MLKIQCLPLISWQNSHLMRKTYITFVGAGNGTVYNNPSDPGDDLSPAFGYAGLRWSQTASYGYVPNPAMPKVFMAVSEDTPDVPGPCTYSIQLVSVS